MCTGCSLCVKWRMKQIKMERMLVCDFTRLRAELTECWICSFELGKRKMKTGKMRKESSREREKTGSWGVNNTHITGSTDLFFCLSVSASGHRGSSLPTKVGVVFPERACMCTSVRAPSVCTGSKCVWLSRKETVRVWCVHVWHLPPSATKFVCMCADVYTAHSIILCNLLAIQKRKRKKKGSVSSLLLCGRWFILCVQCRGRMKAAVHSLTRAYTLAYSSKQTKRKWYAVTFKTHICTHCARMNVKAQCRQRRMPGNL